jgi:hypothetical protein
MMPIPRSSTSSAHPALIALCASLAVGFLQPAPAADAADHAAGSAMSPFGIGSDAANNRSVAAYAGWVPKIAAIGIKRHRTVETSWGALEKVEGQWTWGELDQQMKYLDEQGIAYGAILYGSGRKDRGGTLPVNGLADWSHYVSELASHVKGRVTYFEVWNEPPNGTGRNQTAADYAKVVASAYDATHAVDPTNKLGITAKSVHINYLDQAIAGEAKDHFDWISLHPYEVLNGIADNIGTESIYMHIVPIVRKMLAARDPAKIDVPIIFTELGTDARKGADNQGQTLIKAYAMGIAQGVACIEWFEARDGDSGPMGLLDGKGNPRPSYNAMAHLIEHLGQHPIYLGWVLLNDRDCGFVFHGAKGTVLATWAPKGSPDHVDFGTSVSIVDPLTGAATDAAAYDLTVAPILVLKVPEALVQRAQSNRTKPFPWGGDYSDAKSVSITMGERNIEKGLHTHSGASIAKAVLLYGGSARAGNVPGGNVFVVDPNFLSYTTVPIEIRMVVRRNPDNKPARITLEYESTSGYKKLAPFDIPESSEWSTATWSIDDDQFVNMWAYNFTVTSGSYLIQSVTVTKTSK